MSYLFLTADCKVRDNMQFFFFKEIVNRNQYIILGKGQRLTQKPFFPIVQFQYIKIQLDSEAERTETTEMNKHDHFISFVCVL